MSIADAFRYDNKRAVIVGGATGMGAAVAELVAAAGADVTVMDIAPASDPNVAFVQINLADEASIDAALDAIEGPIDALFSCAGVADGTPGIERINFLGHRHFIDGAFERGLLQPGAAIGFISSAAGLGWETNYSVLEGLFATTGMDDGSAWFAAERKADYFHTKQAVCAYVARQAYEFLRRGVRINAICPGPTDTPLAQANADMWLSFGQDYRDDVGITASTPLEQAYPLAFLCSDAARGISGITLISDSGYLYAGMTGVYPSAVPMAHGLLGRTTA